MPLDTSIPLQVQAPQFQDYSQLAAQTQANALRNQLTQQEMQQNALRLQYLQEDRARAEANRAASARQTAENRKLLTDAFKAPDPAQYLIGVGRPDLLDEVSKYTKSATELGETKSKALAAQDDADLSLISRGLKLSADPQQRMPVYSTLYNHPRLGAMWRQMYPDVNAFAMAGEDLRVKDPTTYDQILSLNSSQYGKIAENMAKPQTYDIRETPQGIARIPTSGAGTVEYVTGPSGERVMGKKTETEAKAELKQEGRKATDETLDRLFNEYKALEDMGVSPTETKSWLENLPAKATTSRVGQALNINPKAQTRIQSIKGLRQDLIRDIKNATGMSAQEMNSNVELQSLLEAATDPSQNIESVKDRLADFSKRYGTGKLAAGTPSAAGATVTTPDGRVFTFKSAEDAAKFKAAAGL